MSEIGVSVLITLCTTLHQYLLLIAWEVYVGIVKWTEYKVLARKGRVKKYTVIAWMESVTKVVLYQGLVFAETLTVVYFYHMIYI